MTNFIYIIYRLSSIGFYYWQAGYLCWEGFVQPVDDDDDDDHDHDDHDHDDHDDHDDDDYDDDNVYYGVFSSSQRTPNTIGTSRANKL